MIATTKKAVAKLQIKGNQRKMTIAKLDPRQQSVVKEEKTQRTIFSQLIKTEICTRDESFPNVKFFLR